MTPTSVHLGTKKVTVSVIYLAQTFGWHSFFSSILPSLHWLCSSVMTMTPTARKTLPSALFTPGPFRWRKGKKEKLQRGPWWEEFGSIWKEMRKGKHKTKRNSGSFLFCNLNLQEPERWKVQKGWGWKQKMEKLDERGKEKGRNKATWERRGKVRGSVGWRKKKKGWSWEDFNKHVGVSLERKAIYLWVC